MLFSHFFLFFFLFKFLIYYADIIQSKWWQNNFEHVDYLNYCVNNLLQNFNRSFVTNAQC
jgi:hypothetical protein